MPSTRNQIIQTTCDLLELQGYHATGLNQIIKESDSPKGSLYYYFPGGKEELAAEAVSQAGAIVLERIRQHLAGIDDPAEAIRTFMNQLAQKVEVSGFRAGGPITTIAMETAATSAPLREECHRVYGAWQREFTGKLRRGGLEEQRAGRLAALVIAAIEGGIILCRTSRSREPLESAAEEIARLIQLTR
jgi:TetR/AcrR family transcriptional repressor of lmrAB and yxaGH operons